MGSKPSAAPDSTAVRVALWRALHVQVDPPPHVLVDDIGLRLALGAGRRDILRMILREGGFLCAVSLALGLPAALALSRLLTRQLYGVTPYDPLTFLFVAVLLAVLALTATYLPARRATRIDPMEILRHE